MSSFALSLGMAILYRIRFRVKRLIRVVAPLQLAFNRFDATTSA